jgi:phospholipase D1/2
MSCLFFLFKHPLFRTLQSQHKGDQYVKCFKTKPAHGPRQPWHDIHSAVRGPEAIHLVRAFEERWKKQANAADLVPLSVLGLDNERSLENNGGWCTQLSRSIDSRVNEFDPSITNAPLQEFNEFVSEALINWTSVQEKNAKFSKRFETATMSRLSRSRYLDLKKGRLVDSSIHTTNIHQIRRAEHFIYIESQYFMGSSFMWEENRGVKCGNMIAAEVRSHYYFFYSLFCFIANF